MTTDISKFMINPDTQTPFTDVLRLSRALDGEQSSIDEKYVLELFYKFSTEEEPFLLAEDASSEFIEWFNESKIEKFINEVLSDEEFKSLEQTWLEEN